MIGLLVKPHHERAAHPEPSVLIAAVVNSFLKRSKEPNPFLKASAIAPTGLWRTLQMGLDFARIGDAKYDHLPGKTDPLIWRHVHLGSNLAGFGISLTPESKKKVIGGYERRMETEIIHPPGTL